MFKNFALLVFLLTCCLQAVQGQKLLEVHQWAKYFETNDNFRIETDDEQNLYVAGTNTKLFDLDFGPGVANSATTGAYFAKYDKNFKLLFYHTFQGNSQLTELLISTDKIYIGISYIEEAVVETIDQKSGQRLFLFSFSASAKAAINSIAVDSKGTYYFAGAVGGTSTIYGQVANQIGAGENGILIRYDPNSGGKNWFRRFTNWGYPGDYKDIDASLVFLASDNQIVTVGNSLIATYIFEQDDIKDISSAGFIARCDSTGNFSALTSAYYVSNEAGTNIEINEVNGKKILYDRYGMGKYNPSLKLDYIKIPFQAGNGFSLINQFVFDKESIFFSGSGLTVEVAGEKIRKANNLIYHTIIGEMDENASLIWYQHMLPYTRIFETRMLPWGKDKILFSGIFYFDTDVDPSLPGANIVKSSNGNRFFAVYDVSCRRLNLKISDIKDLSCENPTGIIKVVATSPYGNIDLSFDNVLQDAGQTALSVLTPGIHSIEARDSFCTQQREVYVHGPIEGPAKPGIGISPGGTRAGLESQLTIGVYNLACTASTGKLQLELPKYYAFISANVPHVLLPNGLFEFDIHDVYYGKTHQLLIKYKIDGMAPAGEEVCLKASYFENEIVGTSQILCQTITNSFDPNDLHVFPGGRCGENYILNTEKIEYLVNFQNLGNDSAFQVSILDTLDGNLDIPSFYLLESSHKVAVTANDSILRFDFKDINLQAKSVNEAKSKGFVRFLINQKQGIPAGTKYENRAHIFFDFNKAVTTNDVFNTVIDELPSCIISSIEPIEKSTVYSIFPNPAYDQILIKNLSGLASVVIYDDKGNLIYNCRAMGSTLIPVSHWKAGIYFICIQEVDGKATMHKIVVARN